MHKIKFFFSFVLFNLAELMLLQLFSETNNILATFQFLVLKKYSLRAWWMEYNGMEVQKNIYMQVKLPQYHSTNIRPDHKRIIYLKRTDSHSNYIYFSSTSLLSLHPLEK